MYEPYYNEFHTYVSEFIARFEAGNVEDDSNNELNYEITADELDNCLRQMQNGKSAGLDGIPL